MEKVFIIGALLFSFAACDRQELKKEWANRDQRVKELDVGMSRLAQQIKKDVGPPECTKDSDCRLVGLGAKVCDKYRDFLVYSVAHTEEYKLLPLVNEFNKLAAEQYDLNLSVLTCGKPMAKVMCVDGGCVPVGDPNGVMNPREPAPSSTASPQPEKK